MNPNNPNSKSCEKIEVETKEEELKESTQDKYRKLHLAFHHSPNRFCSCCINIGKEIQKQQTLKDVLKIIDELKYTYIHSGDEGTSCYVEAVRVDKLKAQIEKELGVSEEK